ncbi:MAG: hypothetical protein EGS62_06800 [Ruminococcus sp.]|nr:hypothetical protein [Ruminococcus sp.]
MLQETNLETALKKVLAGKQVLAAAKKENATRYTFRSLNETLKKYIFLINVPAVEDPDFKEKVTEMVQSVPTAAKGSEKKVEELRRIMYNEEKKYSGFLHIRCKCGAEKSFFTKTGLSFYKCAECGERTELNNLKLALLHCECGEHLRYLTNETERMFDLNCLDCGQPVAMKYNEKKKLYETIRG